MKHIGQVSKELPKTAVLKGGDDVIVKECTPAKESAGKCEDVDVT